MVIEDDVEIGANTTIDRPAVGETRIGRGTKIDNLVQIAHGVHVGRTRCWPRRWASRAARRSVTRVMLAGQVGVAGHLTIGNGVRRLGADRHPELGRGRRVLSGYPAIDNRDWLKASAIFRQSAGAAKPSRGV